MERLVGFAGAPARYVAPPYVQYAITDAAILELIYAHQKRGRTLREIAKITHQPVEEIHRVYLNWLEA